MKPGPDREGKKIESARGDVLAQLSRGNREAGALQFVEQLGMYEMHLPQIGRTRIARDPRAMLDGFAMMRISVDAAPGH